MKTFLAKRIGNHHRLVRMLASLLLALAAGVLWSGCRSTKVSSSTEFKATVGQQLLDLDKAKQQGIINEEEYNKLRRKIIKANE